MLEAFQSERAIARNLLSHEYYLVRQDRWKLRYVAVVPDAKEATSC